MKFTPIKRRGAQTVLAILKGGAKSFHSLEGGGAQKV